MEKPAEPRVTTEKKEKRQSTLKGLAMGLGIGVVATAIAYFAGGWSQGAAYKGQVSSIRKDVAAVQSDNERLHSVNRMLQARGELYEAAVSLERRNYGSASEDLRNADRLLDDVDPARAGVSPAQVEEIRKALNATDLTVQSDVGQQRARLLELADKVGTLIPEPSAPEPSAQ